jgi:hypothetical protein
MISVIHTIPMIQLVERRSMINQRNGCGRLNQPRDGEFSLICGSITRGPMFPEERPSICWDSDPFINLSPPLNLVETISSPHRPLLRPHLHPRRHPRRRHQLNSVRAVRNITKLGDLRILRDIWIIKKSLNYQRIIGTKET